ncbi:hypothetical protein ANCCAN_30576 [Ancylostoma caninum]|uniref:Uncharacterized protein n=1 Tax=Ancylostoma caninum TaxID=29170 RepID=A0A368EYI1_ANCCA|nr:hypothetical protein ANCCAN_30576 [Ancylostoma caninum]
MDDSHFGKCFDELPRKPEKEKGSELMSSSCDIDRCSIDSMDPFGAAPFDPSIIGHVNAGDEPDSKCRERADADSVGSASDLHGRTMDDDSEQDEQRMVARRRFSYENIDGVGDDASSDSRGRTDHDSTDEISKNEESSYDEFNGDCESSQHTDVAGVASDDDGAGSRPLLEDDALDDDEEEVFNGISPSQDQQQLQDATTSLFVDASIDISRRNTNPFLVSASDETPKISPVLPPVIGASSWIERETVGPSCYDEVQQSFFPQGPVPQQQSQVSCVYAPATLPRQSTPLTAAPRITSRPAVPLEASSIIAAPLSMPAVNPRVTSQTAISVSTICQNPVPIPVNVTQQMQQMQINDQRVPPIAEKNPPSSLPKQSFPQPFMEKPCEPSPVCPMKSAGPSFIEGPKTPKPKKSKEKEKKRVDVLFSGSEVETDGSEAEMCTSTSSDKTTSKKKRKSFGLLGSNPSVAPLDLKMSSATGAALLKKSSGKKSSSSAASSSRKGSSGALNASFINSSFLAEDLESPPKQHSLRL